MAEALTYDSLVTDVQTYAERSDSPFVTQIPRLIMMAENRIASEVRNLGTLRIVSFPMTIGASTYAKPARWRETKHMSIVTSSGVKFIKGRGYPYCKSYWPDPATQGEPLFYADYDYDNFLVVPTPSLAYTGELAYYERPEPLTTLNQTNWLTTYAPQLLLYGTLLEAQPFLKMPERMAEFQALYDRAVQAIKSEDMMRVSDSTSNRGET